jgi:hypothetical protein
MATAKASETAKMNVDRLKAVLSQLEREDATIGALLLDAAVAGAVVARHPSDTEFRREAERTWRTLEPLISHHLKSEEEEVLNWAEDHNFPSEVIERARERHQKLRRLVRTVASIGFTQRPDAQVQKAGRALCALAVHLDDLVDGEERVLFPMLHRKLFDVKQVTHVQSCSDRT